MIGKYIAVDGWQKGLTITVNKQNKNGTWNVTPYKNGKAGGSFSVLKQDVINSKEIKIGGSRYIRQD